MFIEKLLKIKGISIVAIVLTGVLLFISMYVVLGKGITQKLFAKTSQTLARSDMNANMCTPSDSEMSQNENPNKHLFISCGGFLE